jgi:hypothetical protein
MKISETDKNVTNHLSFVFIYSTENKQGIKHDFSQCFTLACNVVSNHDGKTLIYGLRQQGRQNRLQKLCSKKLQALKTILVKNQIREGTVQWPGDEKVHTKFLSQIQTKGY